MKMTLRRLLNVQYRVFVASLFNLIRSPRAGQGIRWRGLMLRDRSGYSVPKFLRSISLPLTVSAWSPLKKKQVPNPTGIKLKDMTDAQLLEDLRAADEMYKSGEMSKNDDILERLSMHREKNEPELLWRLARSTFEKSKKVEDGTQKRMLVEEAYIVIKKALELDDSNFAVHKWMAILLNEASKLQGLKEQIKQSFNVKYHMERACELNPQDPTSAYLLGQWCFSVAEVPWYQRQIGAAIFATPPTSTFDEALKYFLRAEKIEPKFYSMNLLMIAKTYLQLGNKDRAIEYLERLAEMPMKTEEDFLARKEGRQIRNKITGQAEQVELISQQVPLTEDK